MKKIIIIAAVSLAVIAGGAFLFFRNHTPSIIPVASLTEDSDNIIAVQALDSPLSAAEHFGRLGFQLPTEKFAAPDFTVKDLNGNPVSLSDFRGRPVLFNLWATWCPPCREEMPSMEKLYTKLKDEGFVILAASSTLSNDKLADVQSYAKKNNFSFHVLFDAEEAIDYSYFTGSIPTSYIIDKDGMMVARLVGGIDWSTPQMETAIRELLK